MTHPCSYRDVTGDETGEGLRQTARSKRQSQCRDSNDNCSAQPWTRDRIRQPGSSSNSARLEFLVCNQVESGDPSQFSRDKKEMSNGNSSKMKMQGNRQQLIGLAILPKPGKRERPIAAHAGR